MPSEAYAPAAPGARRLGRLPSCRCGVMPAPYGAWPGPERPAGQEDDGLSAAAEALQRAGRASSPYALVPADPLAALAASWREMWDVSRPGGSAAFELEGVKGLGAWR